MNNMFSELATALLSVIKPISAALAPLIAGLVIAYLLNPLVIWFESKLKSRGLAIAATYTITISAVCTILCAFIILILGALPQGSPYATLQLVRTYFDDAMNAASGLTNQLLPQVLPDMSESLHRWISSRFSLSSLISTITAVTGGLVTLFVGAVAAVYLLKDKELFIRLWERSLVLILPQRIHGIVSEIMSEINVVITTFIKGALADSIIVALLSSMALTIAGMDYAVILGILAGILNVIPYFGPFISMVPAFLTALLTGGPFQGLLAAAILLAVQQLDANFIYPKIVGASTGLHPLFILLAVSILGSFAGIIGMLLAVPVAGILQVLISRWAYSR